MTVGRIEGKTSNKIVQLGLFTFRRRVREHGPTWRTSSGNGSWCGRGICTFGLRQRKRCDRRACGVGVCAPRIACSVQAALMPRSPRAGPRSAPRPCRTASPPSIPPTTLYFPSLTVSFFKKSQALSNSTLWLGDGVEQWRANKILDWIKSLGSFGSVKCRKVGPCHGTKPHF